MILLVMLIVAAIIVVVLVVGLLFWPFLDWIPDVIYEILRSRKQREEKRSEQDRFPPTNN